MTLKFPAPVEILEAAALLDEPADGHRAAKETPDRKPPRGGSGTAALPLLPANLDGRWAVVETDAGARYAGRLFACQLACLWLLGLRLLDGREYVFVPGPHVSVRLTTEEDARLFQGERRE